MTYRILLVEDNVQICRMIADYFSAQPDNICQLDTVQNGADGLDAARSGEYDLILLDVMLPDLDGFSICRSIRAVSDIPLLFLTARAREEDVLYGYTLGCDDYVVKPFSLATLYAKVLALLKRAKGTILRSELVCGGITLNPLTLAVTANFVNSQGPSPVSGDVRCRWYMPCGGAITGGLEKVSLAGASFAAFSFEGLPPGVCTLVVDVGGASRARERVTVPPGGRELNIKVYVP